MITRPEPDAMETAALVARCGFDPVIAPLLHVQHRRVVTQARYDAIVIASRNAVPSLPEWYFSVPLFAVGSTTAAAARRAGFKTVWNADGDAVALADLIFRTLPLHSKLLLVHGAGQGDALLAMLRRSGFFVGRRRGYAVTHATEFPPAASLALRADQLRSAMFLSAETARAFVRLVPRELHPSLAAVDAVAIGPAAAQALDPLPWHRVRVSVRPTLDEVLAQI